MKEITNDFKEIFFVFIKTYLSCKGSNKQLRKRYGKKDVYISQALRS